MKKLLKFLTFNTIDSRQQSAQQLTEITHIVGMYLNIHYIYMCVCNTVYILHK